MVVVVVMVMVVVVVVVSHVRRNEDECWAQQRMARDRWATKVVNILVSARLPFGVEVQEKGWAYLGPEASRCLRGLRATTLQKRVSDLGPFLRFEGAHGQVFFLREGGGPLLLCRQA